MMQGAKLPAGRLVFNMLNEWLRESKNGYIKNIVLEIVWASRGQ
jgi:hypothetical protein